MDPIAAGAFQAQTRVRQLSHRRLVDQIQKEQLTAPASGIIAPGGKDVLQGLSAGGQQKHRVLQFVVALMLVLAIVLTASGTGIARASQGALPGDLLYSVKRTIEKAELALTPNEIRKAEVYIRNVQSRLDEIQSLLEKNRTEYLSPTISLFEDQAYNAIGYTVVVGEKDSGRARELAGELNSTLRVKSDALRLLAATAPLGVNNEINRLISVSEGMIDF